MAKFLLPSENLTKALNILIRKIKKEKIIDFFTNIGLFAFNIFNKEINVIVIISSGMDYISVFKTEDELFSYQNSLNYDDKAIDLYGYNCISVEFRTEEDIFPIMLKELKKHRQIVKIKDLYGYPLKISRGQNDFIINADEALILYQVLSYLFAIKRIYETGEEEVPKKGDFIASFYFDDEELQYNCNYLSVNSFNFSPKFKFHRKSSLKFTERFSNNVVTPGVLYVGNVNLRGLYDTFKYSNGVKLSLRPIIAYAATDTGNFEYEIYSAKSDDFNRIMRKHIDNLLEKIGLFDLIITDNIYLYYDMKKDLEALGIEIKYDFNSYVNNFFYAASTFDELFINDGDEEFAVDFFDNIGQTYALIYPDVISGKLEENPEESNEEDQEDDFSNGIVS